MREDNSFCSFSKFLLGNEPRLLTMRRTTFLPAGAIMTGFVLLSLFLMGTAAVADGSTSCESHVLDVCREPGSGWSEGACDAVYGDFKGNSNNLHSLMLQHYQGSFKFLVMVCT